MSDHIQENTATLLTDPEPGLRETAVRFFSDRKEVSEEIQENIAALLVDPEPRVRETAVKFFSSRKEVPQETQITIATLTENPGKDSEKAIEFFEKRQQITPSVFIVGVESLMRSQTKLDKMMKTLNNIAVSLIIECFELMEKTNISKEFLRFFVIKLLVSNLSIYQCDKTRIQVGNEHFIHFESEAELSEFAKKLQKSIC